MKSFIPISTPLFASAFLGLLMTGCTTLKSVGVPDAVKAPFGESRSVPRATLDNPAIRVMGLWQPGEGDGLNEGATGRGFVGQIYFFTGKGATPVTVDGDVRIYVFDDLGTLQEQKKPIHQFDYNDGAWQGYQSESAIGPCYNVYVPYTRRGNLEAKCHLRLRLTRPDGTQLFSELTEVQLDGIPRESSVMKRLRTTPEYDLNPESEQQWHAQAETIAIQKAGQFQRVAEKASERRPSERRPPQDFLPTTLPDRRESPARSRRDEDSLPTLSPVTPQPRSEQPARPLQSADREAEIRRLEQKLIELHRNRSQAPRELAPPPDATPIHQQAAFRQLSSPGNRATGPESARRNPNALPQYTEPQRESSVRYISFRPAGVQEEAAQEERELSPADELRAALGVN